ncbi:Fic family protein [Shuttleworthella satelles]|uniref:Fic family protein n=1 Tax=Shuttleworthella satelles TaxID=177972 RepID=UPI002595C954|nr:hypothetical protein [Shuttleworthia satelles]
MREAGLKEPVFADERGSFSVTLYKEAQVTPIHQAMGQSDQETRLLVFLEEPRNRQEIAEYLGIGTVSYAIQAYIHPLIERGLVNMTIPQKPRSRKQMYVRSVNYGRKTQ